MTTNRRADGETVVPLLEALLFRHAEHEPHDPESDTVAWVRVLRGTIDDWPGSDTIRIKEPWWGMDGSGNQP